jgi:MOSC domain-containing protein YiiM
MADEITNPRSIVSVNTGAVRTVERGGKRITTGIFKEPAAGRVRLRGVNLDGDDQADRGVHGGPDRAAYAYAAEDYDWWERELGRACAPGTFGENLTTRGIDVSGALIGERWRVGSAVVAVTSPRVPCYKLAMKMTTRSSCGASPRRCVRARTSRSWKKATLRRATARRSCIAPRTR